MKHKLHLRYALSIAIAMVLSLPSCKKDSTEPSPTVPTAPTPVITPVGEPIGAATSATIGATGGTITSTDGHLTLTIPAGALSSDVAISITPISNEAPLAFADGYRLEPQGTTFAVPITYTFSYTDDMLTGTDEHLLWIVTQATDGHWDALQHSALDATNNTITVQASHFSDWSLGRFVDLALTPAFFHLTVNETLTLSITGFDKPEDVAAEDELVPLIPNSQFDPEALTPLTPIPTITDDQLTLFQAAIWTLNGVDAPTSGPNGSLTGGIRTATYTAPSSVPGGGNLVAVTVELFTKNKANQASAFYLTSNIYVTEQNLFLDVEVDGVPYSYYEYGFNGALPADPNHYFPVTASLDNGALDWSCAEMLNGTDVGHEFFLTHPDVHIGTNVLHGHHFLNYLDAVEWRDILTSGAMLDYETREYDVINSYCATENVSSMVVMKVTKFSTATHIIEGTFQGSLFEDSPTAQNNCETPTERRIKGAFRLYMIF